MKCCGVCNIELVKCESCGYLKMRHDGSCLWCGWIVLASVPAPEHTCPGTLSGENPLCDLFPGCPAHGERPDDLCPACDSEICRCW